MSGVLGGGLSLSQYLEHKTRTGQRHWYFRVEEFALVGNTPRHSLIATHFFGRGNTAFNHQAW
jgi:hypothetical protein